MSFLADEIQKVRTKFRCEDHELNTSVVEFRLKIRDKLATLKKENNLRIFDKIRDIYLGGALRGNRNSRQIYEINNPCRILVRTAYFEKKSLEVPYFRAVFNTRDRAIVNPAEVDSPIRMVAYEAPLMRQNKGRNSRAVSCDLIGISADNCVMCIEGKVRPECRATDIVYGLLEGFAYGVCIDYYLSDFDYRVLFEHELQACWSEFQSAPFNINTNELTAGFALAAPKEYFSDYFTDRVMTRLKANRRMEEAERLLEIFNNIGMSPVWKGFLICDPPCDNGAFQEQHATIIRDNHECCVPLFNVDELNVTSGFSLDDLRVLTTPK